MLQINLLFNGTNCKDSHMGLKNYFWPSQTCTRLINGLGFVCTAVLDPHALGSLYSICDTM